MTQRLNGWLFANLYACEILHNYMIHWELEILEIQKNNDSQICREIQENRAIQYMVEIRW